MLYTPHRGSHFISSISWFSLPTLLHWPVHHCVVTYLVSTSSNRNRLGTCLTFLWGDMTSIVSMKSCSAYTTSGWQISESSMWRLLGWLVVSHLKCLSSLDIQQPGLQTLDATNSSWGIFVHPRVENSTVTQVSTPASHDTLLIYPYHQNHHRE
jgi:hypothetical protein